MTVIRLVCVFCSKEMGEVDGDGVQGISGGICTDCLNALCPVCLFPASYCQCSALDAPQTAKNVIMGHSMDKPEGQ